jgi:hypothetical protein
MGMAGLGRVDCRLSDGRRRDKGRCTQVHGVGVLELE